MGPARTWKPLHLLHAHLTPTRSKVRRRSLDETRAVNSQLSVCQGLGNLHVWVFDGILRTDLIYINAIQAPVMINLA